MGLSISRSIIEAHDGRLWSAPNAPRGSVFHFVLPADTVHGGRPAGGAPRHRFGRDVAELARSVAQQVIHGPDDRVTSSAVLAKIRAF